MAHWLKALTTLTEDPGLYLITYMVTQVSVTPVTGGSDAFFCFWEDLHTHSTQTYIQVQTHVYINKVKEIQKK